MKYKYVLILIVLFLSFNLVSAYKEPFRAELMSKNLGDCKEELGLASVNDKVKILMPEGYCRDLGLHLRIGEDWCGRGGIPRDLKFESSKEGNETSCIIGIKTIYEQACWDDVTKNRIGELDNKRWEIQFGWDEAIGSSYVDKVEFRALNEDDLIEKCKNFDSKRRGIFLGIPLILVSLAVGGISIAKKNGLGKISGVIGLIIGFIVSLLGFLGVF